MNIAEKFDGQHTVVSFEVFPPKKESSIDSIYATIERLRELHPDFISVTYGAGGVGVANPLTVQICSRIQNEYGIDAVAHLTCLNNSKADIDGLLEKLKSSHITNILALRGDRNPDMAPKDDFHYASELAEYILAKGEGFHISGACYPEVHPEAEGLVEDIGNLKKKVDAGAEHLVSQLFFENNVFYDFVEKARIAGIQVPIEAGIMPVTNKSQIERMVAQCGASIPAKLSKLLQRFGDDPKAMQDAGIAYATNQIMDLIANGVDGVHIYTMNKAEIAEKIVGNIQSMVR
ncbi:MAG: methylenetetrahydrofolate reductase [Lachnospiraceae bacterium]|nr:methylenetetrahydrofolate reductase [NAD(P)H] [Lachnospiraceae bacterium]